MSLPEHFMECRVCGQAFDMRDLGDVFSHEHKGVTDDPVTASKLAQIAPGKRVEPYYEPDTESPEIQDAVERGDMNYVELDVSGFEPRTFRRDGAKCIVCGGPHMHYVHFQSTAGSTD